MSLSCGIIGLPNVGKSTIFSALTSASAESANYPFCTIEPNIGIVQLNDFRLYEISKYIQTEKITPTFVKFVDVAGLVKGASKGEGLGNQFLGHIKQVTVISHIVRCFEDSQVIHIDGKIDPINDIDIVNLELIFSDLQSIDKKISILEKETLSNNKKTINLAKKKLLVLEKLKKYLEEGKLARTLNLSEDDKKLIKELNLITIKEMIYVCNIGEKDNGENNKYVKQVKEYAERHSSKVLCIYGKLESEFSTLENEEKKEFMQLSGLKESGLDKLARVAYNALGLETYFTAGKKEIKAWSYLRGIFAPEAAGIIHSDFKKGFIRAEVYNCKDLFELKSINKIKEFGKLRMEGKSYVVKDGDVINFLFNV